MTTPSASTAPDVAPDITPKVEVDDTDEQWARTISTAIIKMLNDKKDKSSKGPVPDPYEGDYKNMRHFLLDLELYFQMNPVKANTDEKKKMLLLSLLKGKTNRWKITEQLKLFSEDDDSETKKKTAEETWSSFKKRFRAEWQPINVAGEAQMKIEEVKIDLDPVTYKLKLPFQRRIHPIFHTGLLTPYKENKTYGPNSLEPPLDIVEGQEEFEVEAIIGHRPKGK
ncbi:hypothetical protein Moror_9478 [Moniliophthora roreri MCA 2997]|uniref:Reverse transcriptase-rnase h-integrase n=2 Tax=Moniliophthora roreri TaxID=221103 RepID=V2WWL9_MONRO|nr:hypothetical protein Moror_9478 [Moniliophthora roreri MCA 2997]